MQRFILAASIAALCTTSAMAQVPTAQPAIQPLVVAQPASAAYVLKEGVELRLVTLAELSSKRAKNGERFDLEVAENVELNGQVVIPAGSRAVGEVTRVKKKGMWGKSGKLDSRLLYVEVGGRRFRIVGASDDKGRAGTIGVVASLAIIPIAGFFVTGTSAVIPARTPVRALLNEDIPVVFAAQSAKPLVVPVTAPAQPAVAAPVVTQASQPQR
jgi:hypothetical protein